MNSSDSRMVRTGSRPVAGRPPLEPLPSLRPKECGRQPNFHWKQEARRAQWASDQRG